MSASWQAFVRLAERQLGVGTRAQALGCGLTDKQLHLRVRSGLLCREHAGVFRLPGATRTPEQTALAASYAAGATAVVSYRTAGAVWGLLEADGFPPEVTVGPGAHPRTPGLLIHRGRLHPRDQTRKGPIPITSPPRTLLDLATVLSDESLEDAADAAFRRGLTDPAKLHRYLSATRLKGARGTRRLRALAVDRAGGVPESALEASMLRLLRRFRLPPPVRQHEVSIRGRRYRFDFAYPEALVGIELDGRIAHAGWGNRQNDLERQNDMEIEGWHVIRFTWRDLHERPDYVALVVARALRLRPARWAPARAVGGHR